MGIPKHHTEPVIGEEEIRGRVRELASQIAKDYKGKKVTLVAVLSGGAVFAADMGRALWEAGLREVEVDYMAVESYGAGTESAGEPKITKDTKAPIAGRHVIVVEDIVDTGYSMQQLLSLLKSKEAASVAVLALLSKPSRRKVEVAIDYLGFEIPDVFVVGYGMDWGERYRTMPEIVKVVMD